MHRLLLALFFLSVIGRYTSMKHAKKTKMEEKAGVLAAKRTMSFVKKHKEVATVVE